MSAISKLIAFIAMPFLFPTSLAYSQYYTLQNSVGVELKGREAVLAKKYMQCLNSNRYNTKQRRTFVPFNTASSIKIISRESDSIIITPLSVNHFYVDNSLVKESKDLTAAGIDSLTDILYNVGYTPVKLPFKLIDPGRNCYNPRNAILFLNAAGEVTHYIEYCFECERYFLSSSKIKNTEYCEQKFEMLKQFFLKQGIQYGTILPRGD